MIPITTIGGYLGAGKTTLINHLLRHANGQRLAVLVNEFGALPIDEDLIEAEDEQLISIAGGCVCCAFGDDLMAGVTRLSQLDPAPDHVLLEASGVAIPGAIAASLSLVRDIDVGAVVVLADAETVQDAARDPYIGDTILRQLSDADLVLLTKTDLVLDLAPVTDWLASHTRAGIVPIVQGVVSLDVIVGPDPGTPQPGSHADLDYDSLVLTPTPAPDVRALCEALATGPYGVLRAKGFVESAGAMWLLQVVGQRFDLTPAAPGSSPGLVCIGLKGRLDQPGLRKRVTGSAG